MCDRHEEGRGTTKKHTNTPCVEMSQGLFMFRFDTNINVIMDIGEKCESRGAPASGGVQEPL